ncbi:hypothetical protein ACH4GM_38925 [Streptomyces coeruleorubidus]
MRGGHLKILAQGSERLPEPIGGQGIFAQLEASQQGAGVGVLQVFL